MSGQALKYLDKIDPTYALSRTTREHIILAYGVGLDAGLEEAQDIVDEIRRSLLAERINPGGN